MKIVHITSGLNSHQGGPVAALLGLASTQALQGMQVSVIATHPDDSDPAALSLLQAGKVHVNLIGHARGRNLHHPFLLKHVEDGLRDCDIIHIHALWESIQHFAATVARRLNKPYIFRPCGMLDPWSLSKNRWMKKVYMVWRLRKDLNAAAAIHYTAEAEREGAGQLKLKPPAIVEPNGVDLDAYQSLPERGAFRKKFGIASHVPLLLFLSRIHPKKGLDLLIPALAKNRSANPNDDTPMLALVGPHHDDYKDEVERLIDRYGVRDRVVWAGMLEGNDKVQAYVDADLFVLPSYQENFGIVVAEAMAAGLPVIISDKVNLDRDVLACGAGGVVPTKVEPLATAMTEWLADPDRRAKAGAAGRKYAFDRFRWDAIARRWQNHYAELIQKHSMRG